MLVFVLFILSKIWSAILLGLVLGLFAWRLGWSRKFRIYVASLSVALALSLLFPIAMVGLYLLLLGGLMALINHFLPESAIKGWLLVFLGMGVSMVPYLLVFFGTSSYSYGYGHFAHQGQTYTVVYQREDFAFLYVERVTLTEYLYPKERLAPLGQRQNELAVYDGEKNPDLSFGLPISEAEKLTYLNQFAVKD